jgi:DNA-binding transcriptional ArsR family regulator
MADRRRDARALKDPRELMAVAHPVRLGILEELTLYGPLSATELGARLGESPANCSWHLRKLAEHDFVEEAEGAGGRRRPWQVTGVGLTWGENDEEPTDEERRAGEALGRMLLERWLDRYHASVGRATSESAAWRDARGMAQTEAFLTAAELKELNQDITAVMQRHQDRLDPAKRPDGARQCELVSWGAPIDQEAAR